MGDKGISRWALSRNRNRIHKLPVQFLTVIYRRDLFFDMHEKHPRNSKNSRILAPRTPACFKTENKTISRKRIQASL